MENFIFCAVYISFRAPGIVFGIAKDGELILKGGIGYADVENGILCNSSTNMRIASISKSLTSIAVGKSKVITLLVSFINGSFMK